MEKNEYFFLINGHSTPMPDSSDSQTAVQYSLKPILQCLNDRKGNAVLFKHLKNKRQEIIR